MSNITKQLKESGFFFKKCYGQNFITNEALLDSIVGLSGINKETVVVEIGVGAGTLTKAISKVAKKVIGYEIDLRLKPTITNTLEDATNVEIIYKDFMKEDLLKLEEKIGEYVVVANLPYYITTPLICRFLEESKRVQSLVIMVQEEVAERLTAKVGSKEYGAITVSVNYKGEASIIKRVPREAFTPMPNVDSAVVKIDITKTNNISQKSFRALVRTAFSSRRKTLANNLINGYKINRSLAEEILNKSGISLEARGETLSAENYITLLNNLDEALCKKQ